MSRPSIGEIGEQGQAAPLVIMIAIIVVLALGAVLGLGAEAVDRGRTQAIADLTALAAAHGDTQGAAVAARNGASIVRLSHGDNSVITVVVDREGRRAVASAQG